MTCDTAIQRAAPQTTRRRLRPGVSSIELLVAFTLLTTTMAVSVPLVVRHGRLLESARQYRIALEELSNQLDRLTALPENELQAALRRLAPSQFTASRLPGAEMSGELQPADIGRRIVLQIVWNEPQRSAAPVTLAAWILPEPGRSGIEPTENEG